MLNLKDKHKKRKTRSSGGAIIAENAAVMYALFFIIFFPLVDLAALGLRAFCLWYCCNQAAMAGSKGSKWSPMSTNTNPYAIWGFSDSDMWYSTSMQDQATNTFSSAIHMFSGISVNSGYPQLSVVLTAINHSDSTNNQANASSVTFSSSQLPLTSSSTPAVVDPSQYIAVLRVTVKGKVQPFLPVPFFVGVPGLSAPFNMTINADQQIENPMALSS